MIKLGGKSPTSERRDQDLKQKVRSEYLSEEASPIVYLKAG